MMFSDRTDAGRRLAAELARFKSENPCILALPRGGVVVAHEVAKTLDAPLDLLLVRKIGAPSQPELAVAAVLDGKAPELVINKRLLQQLHLSDEWLAHEETKELREIERRRTLYLGGRPRLDVSGKTAIIVDDGIATGATVLAAIHAIRRSNPKHLVLAVPVAPASTLRRLASAVDDIVCLIAPEDFGSVGAYYYDFTQVDDDTVRRLLALDAGVSRAARP